MFKTEKKESDSPVNSVYTLQEKKLDFCFSKIIDLHVPVTLNNPQPLSISLKTEENTIIKNVFALIRAPAAILPEESANCMQSSAGCNTAGRTLIKIKKWRQNLKSF
jgi:hypothetical protein